MLESVQGNKLEYQRLTQEEQSKRGILGRLKGIIASFKSPTRNGRLYSEKLWDNVFEDPIMKEKISNRCVFGELGHPTDREEVDMEKIAICLAEQPKKDGKGNLLGDSVTMKVDKKNSNENVTNTKEEIKDEDKPTIEQLMMKNMKKIKKKVEEIKNNNDIPISNSQSK